MYVDVIYCIVCNDDEVYSPHKQYKYKNTIYRAYDIH